MGDFDFDELADVDLAAALDDAFKAADEALEKKKKVKSAEEGEEEGEEAMPPADDSDDGDEGDEEAIEFDEDEIEEVAEAEAAYEEGDEDEEGVKFVDPNTLRKILKESAMRKHKKAQELPSLKEKSQKDASGEKSDYYEKYLHAVADLENYKKRVEKEREEQKRFRYEGIVKQLLPVVDNFERALAHCEKHEAAESLFDGVRMIYKQIFDIFRREGVSTFDSVGQTFDPVKHQAVQMMASGEYPANTVIEEMQKGYFMHDRLLRAAMVIVSSGGAGDVAKSDEAETQDEMASDETES